MTMPERLKAALKPPGSRNSTNANLLQEDGDGPRAGGRVGGTLGGDERV